MAKISPSFQMLMDSLVALSDDDFKVYHNKDGSKTIAWQARLVFREWSDGRRQAIEEDLPPTIYTVAGQILDKEFDRA